MGVIADSDAIHDISRILPQHQSALTLLNSKLQNPAITSFSWLDLACGKGQIISQLEDNLSVNQRKKLRYTGYDINIEYTRTAEKLVESYGLEHHSFLHGDISTFNKVIDASDQYDFITCTNTAHELQPGAFADLFLHMLQRLTDQGELFIYDMENLLSPELGALPWKTAEINNLLMTIFEELDTKFVAEPSAWNHSNCRGWSVTIQKEYVQISNEEIEEAKPELSKKIENQIDAILENRSNECNKVLESFCKYGAESAEDISTKESALYEYWALQRAKEMRK